MACKIYKASDVIDGKPKDGAVGIDLTNSAAVRQFIYDNDIDVDGLAADLTVATKTSQYKEQPNAKQKVRSLFARIQADAKQNGRFTENQVRNISIAVKYYNTTSNNFASNQADVLIQAAKDVPNGIETLWEDAIDLKFGGEIDAEFSIKSMIISKIADYYNQIGEKEMAQKKYEWMVRSTTDMGKFLQAITAQAHPEALIARRYVEFEKGKDIALDRINPVQNKTNGEIIDEMFVTADTLIDEANTKLENNETIAKAAEKTAKKHKERTSKKEYKEKVKKQLNDAVKSLNETLGINLSIDDENIQANGLTMGSLVNLIAEAAVAAKTVTETIEEAVDKVIRVLKQKGFIGNEINIPELKQTVADRLQQETAKRQKQAEKAARKYVKEALVDEYGILLQTIVKEYYNEANAFKGKLVDRLMMDANLSQDEAKEFAKVVEREYDKMIAEGMDKMKKKASELVPYTKDKLPALERAKVMRKINKMMALGKVPKADFQNVFSDTIGFVALSPDQQQKLAELKEMLSLFPPSSDEYYQKLQIYNTFIDGLKEEGKTGRAISRVSKELYYLNLLSGIATFSTNIRGIIHTFTPSSLIELSIRKDPKLFFEAYNSLYKGLGTGAAFWKQMMRTGFNSQYASEEAKKPITPLMKLMATPYSEANWKEIPVKMFMSGPVYMVRAFLATDALAKMAFREFYATIKAYDDLLLEGQGKKGVDFWNKVHDRACNSKADLDRYKMMAKLEQQTYINKGIPVSKDFVSIRAAELQQAERDADIANYAERLAQESTLNNKPYGTLGVLYDALNQFQQKIPLAYNVIPFIKIAINLQDTWLSYSPYGIKRALMGRGFANRNTIKNWNKYRMGTVGDEFNLDRRTHLVKAAIGTAAYLYAYGALQNMLDKDDNEETAVWNVFEDVTANISNDPQIVYEASINKKKPRKPYTIYLKGSIEITYRESVFAPAFAWMGYALDEKRNYKKGEPKTSGRITAEGFVNAALFVKESSFLEGFSAISQFGGRYQDVLSETPQATGKFAANYAKNHLYPKFYESVYKGYKTLAGKDEYAPARFDDDFVAGLTETFSKNIPFLEDTIDNKLYDKLGYPIKTNAPQVFPIPFVQQTAVDWMRDDTEDFSRRSEEHAFVIGKGCRVDYIIDRKDLNGNVLNKTQWTNLSIKVGEFVRERIKDDMVLLNNMSTEDAQKAIDGYAKEAIKVYKEKLFGGKAELPEPAKSSMLNLIERKTKREAKEIKKSNP